MGGDRDQTTARGTERVQPAAPSVFWRYRTANGVVHYVGAEARVPPAFRASAQRVDIADVPINTEIEKGLEETETAVTARALADTPHAARRPPSWLPDLTLLVGLALLLAAAATLLHLSYRRRFTGNARAWWAARIARWLAALAVVLVLVRATLPHLGRWRKQLARLGMAALIVDEERNSDVMRENIEKAALEGAGVGKPASQPAPAAPFWAKPVPGPLSGHSSDGATRAGGQ